MAFGIEKSKTLGITKGKLEVRNFTVEDDGTMEAMNEDDIRQPLNYIPQNSFQECYKEWQHRWKTCVQAQGMYFEGDHISGDK
jgi:hypothetical protein